MPASSLGCDAGEQVVERQHRVGLAAAEVGLELHHRVAALAGEALHRADQQPLQALGEIGAAEELDRVAVLVRALAQMHLPEVGGELGLLVAAAGHVLVRRHHLAPGLEGAGRLRSRSPCRRSCASRRAPARRSAARSSSIFILLDLVGLRRRDGGQQPRQRVERAVGVVARRMAPGAPTCCGGRAARCTRLRSARPERLAEDVVPGLPHQLEQRRHVPLGDRLLARSGGRRQDSARSLGQRPGPCTCS